MDSTAATPANTTTTRWVDSILRTSDKSRQHTTNDDVNNDQSSVHYKPLQQLLQFDDGNSRSDNDLFGEPSVAGLRNERSPKKRTERDMGGDENDEDDNKERSVAGPSHVNSLITDLVAAESSAEIGALVESAKKNRKKWSLVKSKTCCDFYCKSCESPPQSEQVDCDSSAVVVVARPIPIYRSIDRGFQRKKLFPSFSHPDTSFLFTDDELLRAGSPTLGNRRNWRRRDPDLELAIEDGPPKKEFLGLDLNRKKKVSVLPANKLVVEDSKTPISDYTIIAVHPEIAVKVRNRPVLEGDNERRGSAAFSQQFSQLKVYKSESDAGEGDFAECERNGKRTNDDCPSGVNPVQNSNEKDRDEVLIAANKYFEESGIFGPVSKMGNTLFRKSSKVHIIDGNQFEQIRKHSRTIQRSDKTKNMNILRLTPPHEAEQKVCSNIKGKDEEELELSNLRELLKKRDSEIGRLKREIHKLKSVLQQTSEAPLETDLISRIQSPVQGNVQQPAINPNSILGKTKDLLPPPTTFHCTGTGTGGPVSPLHPVAMKKQGVSAESSDNKQHLLKGCTIEVHAKDFRAKQLIKDAILDNDFLKNLDSSQIKILVEAMYLKLVPQGEYVIREGESGDHLFISDDGEFEVIKDDVILGRMGPGKAFGELAILYNCKRTASIRVLADSKVWVLDRRVFQQIMMRTGLEKIEENINFLRSVPLLKHLGVDSLAKIADVLELEFFPSGTYIIRQDTSGDSFFLISQGNVKVTQRLPGTKIEEEIRVLGRGDYFGEQALIKEDKRTANIVALSPGVECLTLDRASFRKYIGDLSELHAIDYGDEWRATSFKEHEKELLGGLNGANNPQLLHIDLSDLEIVATLGVGGFGRVELVRHCKELARTRFEEKKKEGEETEEIGSDPDVETFALKCLKKQHIVDTKQEEHVFNERSIMMSCDSKFICRLYRTYRDTKYVYMLLEACLGGEIWTILRNRGSFDDYSGKFIIGCVLEAFQYLHSRGIVYRDLKPENLLLDANGYVKLVDFGFAKYIGFSSKTWTFCGTPEYVAPEIILNKGHDRAVDYWALGILVFELLTGAPPFTSSDPMKTYNIILKNLMDFPSHLSKTAINFIKRLCRDVPAERLGYPRGGGVQEIKKHKWFQGFDWDGLTVQTLQSPILNAVESAIDTSNFDCFPMDVDIPPDEFSGWDQEF